MDELTKEEKFNLMIALMEDLRGDWSELYEERANKVKELAIELGYSKTVTLVDSYFKGISKHGDPDGRHFRCDWEMFGGYEGAPDKLKDCESLRKIYISAIKKWCNFPENRLES